MYVNHKLNMDLAGPAVVQKVDMVQRDQYVRLLTFALFCDGESWLVPEDVHPIICYQKSDGTGGEYDTLPDGRRAWSAEGNTLTVEVAPQMLTVPGPVRMAVDLLLGDAKLSTFTVMLYVQKAIPLGLPSGDYFKLEGFLSAPKEGNVGQLLRISGVSDSGCVTGVEGYDLEDAVNVALEQAKETGAFDGKSAYQVALDNGFEGTEAEWLESLKGKGVSAVLGNIAQINITGQLTTDYNVIVDFNGSRLQRVKTPVADTDGVNKAYVDQAVANCNADAVPEYWAAALEETAQRVHSLQKQGGRKAVSFVWFSDMRLMRGESASLGILAAKLMDKCRIPFAVFTGDAIAEGAPTPDQWSENHSDADAVFAPVGSDRLIQAQGILDGTWGADNATAVDKNRIYDAVFRKQELDVRRKFGGDGSYYYVDIPGVKLRMVVLNPFWLQDGTLTYGFGNEQINWFAFQALKFTEEGWALAFACHVPPTDSRMLDGDKLLDVLWAFGSGSSFKISAGTEGADDYISASGDYSAAIGAQIIGFFCGSTRNDEIHQDANGYKITTITTAIEQSASTAEEIRIPGTDNEYAMDVVTIDRESGIVNLSRLGAGNSRYYHL